MNLSSLIRAISTVALLGAAIVLGHTLWNHYMYAPWTRDGRVRAKVVNIAPDVAGIVTDVPVADNQFVHRGDILFDIDRERFRLALQQSEAEVALRKSEFDMRKQQAARRAQLDGSVISTEVREDSGSQARQAYAGYQAALAAREVARLNLERSAIRSPVDGYVTNLNLYPGDYASVGAARLAVIDRNSYWVYGYFEETKLPHVHVGDKAEIRLLSGSPVIEGHVESIARGVSDRDNPSGPTLLADVNPVFTWVRLAQRIPVRIHLDAVPDDVPLAAGTTCTVTILPAEKASKITPVAISHELKQ